MARQYHERLAIPPVQRAIHVTFNVFDSDVQAMNGGWIRDAPLHGAFRSSRRLPRGSQGRCHLARPKSTNWYRHHANNSGRKTNRRAFSLPGSVPPSRHTCRESVSEGLSSSRLAMASASITAKVPKVATAQIAQRFGDDTANHLPFEAARYAAS